MLLLIRVHTDLKLEFIIDEIILQIVEKFPGFEPDVVFCPVDRKFRR